MRQKRRKAILFLLTCGATLFHGGASCSVHEYDHYDFGFFDVFVADDDDLFDIIFDF